MTDPGRRWNPARREAAPGPAGPVAGLRRARRGDPAPRARIPDPGPRSATRDRQPSIQAGRRRFRRSSRVFARLRSPTLVHRPAGARARPPVPGGRRDGPRGGLATPGRGAGERRGSRTRRGARERGLRGRCGSPTRSRPRRGARAPSAGFEGPGGAQVGAGRRRGCRRRPGGGPRPPRRLPASTPALPRRLAAPGSARRLAAAARARWLRQPVAPAACAAARAV